MIKFYSDEMVPAAVTEGLLLHGVDVLTARDAGRLRYPDAAQLAFATEQGRVMITMDEDYLLLHSQGQPHAGIAYTPQAHRTFGEMIQAKAAKERGSWEMSQMYNDNDRIIKANNDGLIIFVKEKYDIF